jgi:AraC-like DNA-binding protein
MDGLLSTSAARGGHSLSRHSSLKASQHPITESIRFHRLPVDGIDAMSATSVRSFPRHTHDQFGVGVIDTGGHASLSEHGQVEAGAGSCIFVNPGEVHDGRAICSRSRSWRMLYFDPAVFANLRTEVHESEAPDFAFVSAARIHRPLRASFDAAFSYAQNVEPQDTMACETALLNFAAQLSSHGSARPDAAAKATPGVKRVRDRIDADPSAPLTLYLLANDLGISRYQLIRGFARELGLTPHAYILQQRVALARRLILAGHDLAEVAQLAGFCDQSHLNRCFVRQFGLTPRRYAVR